MYYTYILKTNNKEYYIGYTNDLMRRLREHQKEKPCKLIYYEAYLLENQARDRERRLKYYGSAWKSLRRRINA